MADQRPVPAPDFFWTAMQRRVLLLLLSILLAVCAGRYACHRAFIDDPPPAVPARAEELADRLDPNTATWQELSAIPTLGEKKAKAIVEYRQAWQRTHPGSPAFAAPQDLRHIKGIGMATVSNMTPYLLFPASPAPPAVR